MKAEADCIMHAGRPQQQITCSFYRGVLVVLTEVQMIPCFTKKTD
jgi:hypothetical protein